MLLLGRGMTNEVLCEGSVVHRDTLVLALAILRLHLAFDLRP